jgi:hypothetical protein
VDFAALQPLLPLGGTTVVFVLFVRALVQDRTEMRAELARRDTAHRLELAELEARCRTDADQRVKDVLEVNAWLRIRVTELTVEGERLRQELRDRDARN